MTLHIRDTTTGPVVLGPNSKHLTSISSTGAVISTGIGVDGIDGPATNPWPIENDGTITASGGLGISLAAGGTVGNGPGALISGGIAGILINGAGGTVANAGTVDGVGIGSTVVNSTLVISGDGIAFAAGGSVTNAAGGSISAGGAIHVGDASGSGVFITGGPGSVTNHGNISATAYGVALDGGGSVTNTASIQGGEDGVKINGLVGTVTNSGSIVATVDDGVGLFNGGDVKNLAGGSIKSGPGFAPDFSAAGVFIDGASGTVENSGSIEGTKNGALLTFGGSVTNSSGASISGGVTAGVFFGARAGGEAGTLDNAGSISGGGTGADLEAGGLVTNAAGGLISGTGFGVFVGGAAGTVVNAGTLAGGAYALKFAGGGTNTLVVEPGAVFAGAVGGSTAAGASNTLELAPGVGSIGGIGTGSFNNFQNSRGRRRQHPDAEWLQHRPDRPG